MYVPYSIIEVIEALCIDIRQEWQMLLKGTINGTFVTINGYYIPKQQVTGASVHNLDNISREFIQENNIVATIHSHSTMGVFFSSTDDEMTNKSAIKYHLVVNNALEFIGKGRFELPCGMSTFKNVDIKLEKPAVKNVVVEGLENITKGTPPLETWNTGANNTGYLGQKTTYPIVDGTDYEGYDTAYNKKSDLILRNTDRDIITSENGTQEGGYTYDAMTDTYILDDGTVVEGLNQEWDDKGERYIYGTPGLSKQ